MAQIATLDLATLTRIEEHPDVSPLVTKKASLLHRERALHEQMAALNILLAQPDDHSAIAIRQAKAKLATSEDQLSEVRARLMALAPELDAVISQARYTLKPLFESEAVQLREAMAPHVQAIEDGQKAFAALVTRAKRLGIRLR